MLCLDRTLRMRASHVFSRLYKKSWAPRNHFTKAPDKHQCVRPRPPLGQYVGANRDQHDHVRTYLLPGNHSAASWRSRTAPRPNRSYRVTSSGQTSRLRVCSLPPVVPQKLFRFHVCTSCLSPLAIRRRQFNACPFFRHHSSPVIPPQAGHPSPSAHPKPPRPAGRRPILLRSHDVHTCPRL